MWFFIFKQKIFKNKKHFDSLRNRWLDIDKNHSSDEKTKYVSKKYLGSWYVKFLMKKS